MITEKNNVFYCDCGFSFLRGHSGAHDCAVGLRNKLAKSEARCAALAAENAGLKAFGDKLYSMYKGLETSGGGFHDEQSVIVDVAQAKQLIAILEKFTEGAAQ